MGKILALSGPRGVGKTTIIHELMAFDVNPIAPYTTRPLRQDEVEGRDYRQVSVEQFDAIHTQTPMFDLLNLRGTRYGTPFADIEEAIDSYGIRTFNVAAKTALDLRSRYGRHAVSAVMLLPACWDDIRMQMLESGTPEAQIEERISKEPTDLSLLPYFDEIVVNRFRYPEETVLYLGSMAHRLANGHQPQLAMAV